MHTSAYQRSRLHRASVQRDADAVVVAAVLICTRIQVWICQSRIRILAPQLCSLRSSRYCSWSFRNPSEIRAPLAALRGGKHRARTCFHGSMDLRCLTFRPEERSVEAGQFKRDARGAFGYDQDLDIELFFLHERNHVPQMALNAHAALLKVPPHHGPAFSCAKPPLRNTQQCSCRIKSEPAGADLDFHAQGMGQSAQDHNGAADLEQVSGEVRQRDLLYRCILRQWAYQRLGHRPAHNVKVHV